MTLYHRKRPHLMKKKRWLTTTSVESHRHVVDVMMLLNLGLYYVDILLRSIIRGLEPDSSNLDLFKALHPVMTLVISRVNLG